MIEIRLLDPTDWVDDWVEVTADFEVHNMNFKRAWLKIDGKIYTQDTKEFREHFKKAKLWIKLKA